MTTETTLKPSHADAVKALNNAEALSTAMDRAVDKHHAAVIAYHQVCRALDREQLRLHAKLTGLKGLSKASKSAILKALGVPEKPAS